MFHLTNNDYIKILKYYNINIPKKKIKTKSKKQIIDNKKLKNIAEDILATKLCRCIKSVDPQKKDEKRAITVCTNSVFKKKGLSYQNFSCKMNGKLLRGKKTRKILLKKKKSRINITSKGRLRNKI